MPSALPSSTAANRLENPIKVFSPGQFPSPSKNPVLTDALGFDTPKGGRRDGGQGRKNLLCTGETYQKVKCFVMIDSSSAF